MFTSYDLAQNVNKYSCLPSANGEATDIQCIHSNGMHTLAHVTHAYMCSTCAPNLAAKKISNTLFIAERLSARQLILQCGGRI